VSAEWIGVGRWVNCATVMQKGLRDYLA